MLWVGRREGVGFGNQEKAAGAKVPGGLGWDGKGSLGGEGGGSEVRL